MPRYELMDGRSSKFWEVELVGDRLTRWWGRSGTAGKTSTRDFPGRERALREYRRLAASKLQAGYRLVGGNLELEISEPPAAADPEIVGALRADPGDADTCLVYADWLQRQGDPRGELITVQHALHVERSRPVDQDAAEAQGRAQRVFELRQAEEALLERHRQHFLGGLSTFAPGPSTSRSPGRRQGRLGLTWQFGFIHTASLGVDELCADDAETILGSLGSHASGQLVQRLELGLDSGWGDGADLRSLIRLAAGEAVATVRELALGPVGNPYACEGLKLGKLRRLLAAYPGLRRLELAGQTLTLEAQLDLPELREVSLTATRLQPEWLEAVAATSAQRLELIALFGPARIDHLRWMFERNGAGGSRLPELRGLTLGYSAGTDSLCRLLVDGPLAGQLEQLNLADGELTDHGARILSRGRDRLARLEFINVDGNHLTDEALESLKKAGFRVYSKEQYE